MIITNESYPESLYLLGLIHTLYFSLLPTTDYCLQLPNVLYGHSKPHSLIVWSIYPGVKSKTCALLLYSALVVSFHLHSKMASLKENQMGREVEGGKRGSNYNRSDISAFRFGFLL